MPGEMIPSPALLEQLSTALNPKPADLRRGLLFGFVGLACVLLAFAVDEPDARGPLLGVAAFPFLVGCVHLILWRLADRNADRNADGKVFVLFALIAGCAPLVLED